MSGAKLRAGVFGWPVGHSKSPRLHGHWLARYGIDGAYEHLPAKPEAFESEVKRLASAGWRGANVTLPHKERAFALADETTDRARAMQAANTLIFRDGRIIADNTDGFGFIENLKAGGAPAFDRPALVLGAGGAARAVVWSLIAEGAPEVRVANRTKSRAEALASAFGDKVRVVDWNGRDEATADAGLLVNTTSLGMDGQPPLEIDLGAAAQDALATDIVYTPLMTPFLRLAAERRIRTVDGLGMLLHQARPGFAAWFGREPEVDDRLREVMLAP